MASVQRKAPDFRILLLSKEKAKLASEQGKQWAAAGRGAQVWGYDWQKFRQTGLRAGVLGSQKWSTRVPPFRPATSPVFFLGGGFQQIHILRGELF